MEKILDLGLNHHLAKSPSPGVLALPSVQTHWKNENLLVTWWIRSCSKNRALVLKTRKTDKEQELIRQD